MAMTSDAWWDAWQCAVRGTLQQQVATAYAQARELRGDALRLQVLVNNLPAADENKNIARLQAIAYSMGLYERMTRGDGVETFEDLRAMNEVVDRSDRTQGARR